MFDTCEMKALVFVYGTLKEGFGNHSVMARSGGVKLDTTTTKPEYTMHHLGGFPGVAKGGNTAVQGEVYQVDRLEPLDALEGHPTFYKREEITLSNSIKAWIYIINDSYTDNRVIEDGIWT